MITHLSLYLNSFSIKIFFFVALCNDDNPIFKSTQTNINKNNILSNLTTTTTSSTIPSAKDYHCDICGQTLKLTSIEILRHRATHQT